jgi:hypothetical protein
VLIALTYELKTSKCGYQLYGSERKICHLLYMDVLKVTGVSEEELSNEIRIIKTISNIRWGLD